MGLFDLVKNTVEGVAQATVNVVMLPVGVLVAPLDDGKAIEEAAKGIAAGVGKIGDTKERDDGR